MSQSTNTLKDELIETDDEFGRLYREHQSYEGRLDELNQKSLLSPEDELEEKRLKRQKLWLKDRMELILRSHQGQQLSA